MSAGAVTPGTAAAPAATSTTTTTAAAATTSASTAASGLPAEADWTTPLVSYKRASNSNSNSNGGSNGASNSNSNSNGGGSGASGQRGRLPPKVYVGHLPFNVAKRELDDLFGPFGRIISVEIKHGGYAFVQFETAAQAEASVAALNNSRFDGRPLLVEFSNRREAVGNSCLLCGNDGHWARDCPLNKERGADVKSGKCFKCGSYGHLARFCRGPGTETNAVRRPRSRSRSRSPIRRDRSPPPSSHGRFSHQGSSSSSGPSSRYDDYRSRERSPPRRGGYGIRSIDSMNGSGPMGGPPSGGRGGPGPAPLGNGSSGMSMSVGGMGGSRMGPVHRTVLA
ncbi:hypothetical protein BC831DRAFT_159766 [Entophlyctis helioformis]|nr:hypothetical protein BC831DRAFT_159766 [Entophlyctis helioformis]